MKKLLLILLLLSVNLFSQNLLRKVGKVKLQNVKFEGTIQEIITDYYKRMGTILKKKNWLPVKLVLNEESKKKKYSFTVKKDSSEFIFHLIAKCNVQNVYDGERYVFYNDDKTTYTKEVVVGGGLLLYIKNDASSVKKFQKFFDEMKLFDGLKVESVDYRKSRIKITAPAATHGKLYEFRSLLHNF